MRQLGGMDDWPDRPQDLSRWILEQRSPKNALDARRAYGAFVEQEPDAAGRLRDVARYQLEQCHFAEWPAKLRSAARLLPATRRNTGQTSG